MNKVNTSFVKLYVLPFLVVVTIVLLVPLVLMPQLENIRDRNLEVKQKEERLEVLNTKLEDLENINEPEEIEQLQEIRQVVPDGKELAQLVQGVRTLAASSDLVIDAMELAPGSVATSSATPSASKKAQARAASEDEDALIFIASLRGENPAEYREFFTKIEKAKRLLGVESVAISRDEEDNDYIYDVEIRAPFKEIGTKGRKVDTPLPKITDRLSNIFAYVTTELVNYTNIAIQEVKRGVSDPFD